MSGRAPRDVVFDLGGVLVDWDPRYLLCGHLGYSREQAEWLLANVCTPDWHRSIDGGRDFEEAGDELARAHPEHAAVIRAYTREWPRMFAGEHRGAVRLLDALSSAGFRLHALSNYPRRQIAFLYRRFAFMRVFDTVVLSGLIGVQKPAAGIYEYLAGRLGSRDWLFLDDRAENVEAARALGVSALRFSPPPADAELTQVVESAGLRELLEGRLPRPN